MLLKDLYQKSIERNLNPVVNAENLDAETVKTEIEEYVFTEEIIDGLYKILDAIRSRRYNHDGIWINGYFGSGKSHFLKYLNYCFDPKYRDAALERLKEGVNEFDPLTDTRFEVDGFAIVTRKKFAEFLDGTVIDYRQTDSAAGFSIENPNFPAGSGRAGCGAH